MCRRGSPFLAVRICRRGSPLFTKTVSSVLEMGRLQIPTPQPLQEPVFSRKRIPARFSIGVIGLYHFYQPSSSEGNKSLLKSASPRDSGETARFLVEVELVRRSTNQQCINTIIQSPLLAGFVDSKRAEATPATTTTTTFDAN